MTNNGSATAPLTITNIRSIDDLERLVQELSPKEKEKLAQMMFAQLPTDAKVRAMASELGSSGLIVVMDGSNCCINSEITIQIQNAPSLDFVQIMEALISKHHKDKHKSSAS